MIDYKVGESMGWKKYFTFLFWRIQIKMLINKGDFSDGVDIIEIKVDSDFGKAIAKAQKED
jgi:hypothetical protein